MADNEWHEETDVIIVGGGLAGYCTAHEGARQGAEVLLLEKEAQAGGSTVLSGGFLAFADTEVQRKAGVCDSDELLVRDLLQAGGGANDERLVKAYGRHQRVACEWLLSLGVEFNGVQLASAHSVPRAHATDARRMLQLIADEAHGSGRVRTLLNTPARRLIKSAHGERVSGALATVDGRERAIRARRGVVLASGGFSRNAEMIKNFAPAQARAVPYGGSGNTGDGLRMAWALGAGLRDMGQIKGTFGFSVAARSQAGGNWTKLFVYRGAIAVNKEGRRFVDESLSYKLLGDAVLGQPEALAYQICDQAIFDTAADGVPPFDFRDAQRRGLVVQAETLEALASRTGLEPATLVATVARYNDAVARGIDAEFGRDGLSNHYGKLVRIEHAPFYAYAATSGLIATYCGLTVDEQARAIDVYGEPIASLYAAGEIMGGFHGVAYVTGSALGKCVIFGRIAGRNASAVNMR